MGTTNFTISKYSDRSTSGTGGANGRRRACHKKELLTKQEKQ